MAAADTKNNMKKTLLLGSVASLGTLVLFLGFSGLGVTRSQAQSTATKSTIGCDDTLKAAFHPDANTQVLLVHNFKQGEVLQLPGAPADSGKGGRGGRGAATAASDICVVKLLVGPGNPGPADAPSTTPGIGIEVWLPAPSAWNQRIRVMGGGGFAGGPNIVSTATLGGRGGAGGYVTAVTDTGHTTPGGSGAFLLTPDGKINTVEWRDFADRGIHETAVKTKALAALYYGRPELFAYFDGCSTGGRQGLKEAQEHPEDFDGILAGAPAINWTQFITSELYPQIVMQRDLGKAISARQLDLVSAAAVTACDSKLNGSHDGFITDPASCDYDPTKDKTVLCAASGGSNSTDACVSTAQAAAIIKMWYGQTTDGSAPAPTAANGFEASLASKRVWFGLTRGTRLVSLAGSTADGVPSPFEIATETVALNLENPKLASPGPLNPKGQNGWLALTYADLAKSAERGRALQTAFGKIDSNNPDLSKFKSRNGKLLQYHGLADVLIAPQGSRYYYGAVSAKLGGYDNVKDFYRLYEIPGMGHCNGVGSANGVDGVSPAAAPPLPAQNQLFQELVSWVEQKKAPEQIVLTNAQTQLSRKICPFPLKPAYVSGDRNLAASYACAR